MFVSVCVLDGVESSPSAGCDLCKAHLKVWVESAFWRWWKKKKRGKKRGDARTALFNIHMFYISSLCEDDISFLTTSHLTLPNSIYSTACPPLPSSIWEASSISRKKVAHYSVFISLTGKLWCHWLQIIANLPLIYLYFYLVVWLSRLDKASLKLTLEG